MSMWKVLFIPAGIGLAAVAVIIFAAAPASAQSIRVPTLFEAASSHIGISVRDVDQAEAARQKIDGGVLVEAVDPGKIVRDKKESTVTATPQAGSDPQPDKRSRRLSADHA